MVFTRLVKAASVGAVAALALTLGMTGAMAQGKDKGAKPTAPAPAPQQQANAGQQPPPNVWYKLCADMPVPEPAKPGEPPKQQKPEEMKKVNVCLTQFDVHDPSIYLLISKIALRQVQGQDKPQIFAMLPLGALLPAGARVRIDEKDEISITYSTCDQAGCYAEAVVEPAVIDQMKTGKAIEYRGIDVLGRMPRFRVPLEGFAKAFEGAPTPPDKYTEDQKKIADFIRFRLAELRKAQEEAAKTGQTPGGAPGATPGATPPKK
jgi:invasion protein IalB